MKFLIRFSLFFLFFLLVFTSSATANPNNWYFDFGRTEPTLGFISSTPSGNIGDYFYVFPRCDVDVITDCIESLIVTDLKSGTKVGATLENYLPLTYPQGGRGGLPALGLLREIGLTKTFKPMEIGGLPLGATSSFWSVRGLPGFKDFSILASVGFQGALVYGNGKWEFQNSPQKDYTPIEDFKIDLSPARGYFSDKYVSFGSKTSCMIAAASRYFCLDRQDENFINLQIDLTLKIPRVEGYLKKHPTWKARISNFELEFLGPQTLKVSGSPMSYANATFDVPKTQEIFEYLKTYFDSNYVGGDPLWKTYDQQLKSEGGSFGPTGFDEFKYLAQRFEPKPILNRVLSDSRSAQEYQQWSIEHIPSYYDFRDANRTECLDESALPLIYSTDSAVQSDSPPVWDASINAFSFRVAAAGQTLSGEKRVGYFSMFMSKAIAQCFYGKQATSPTAEIVVTTKSGDSELILATSMVQNLKSFVKVEATGFGYSAKTLLVKVVEGKKTSAEAKSPVTTGSGSSSQVMEVKEESSMSEGKKSAMSTVIKKKFTISCTKGNQIRKVTGLNPKCPAGFKKK